MNKKMLHTVLKNFVLMVLLSLLSFRSWADFAYLAYEKGFWQVFLYELASNSSRKLTQSAYDKNVVSWYPDGQSLLINTSQGQLVKLDVPSQKETTLNFPVASFYDAQLSPDGKRLTFSYSATGETDDSAIWVADINGENMRKLSNMSGLQHSPRWDASGAMIYFISNSYESGNGIWRVDAVTGQTMQLVSNRNRHFDVIPLTRDDSDSRDEDTVNSTSGPSVNQASLLSKAHFLSVNNQLGQYEVWLKSPGQPIRNISNHHSMDSQPMFDLSNNTIYFVSTRPDTKIKKRRCWQYLGKIVRAWRHKACDST